MALRLSASLGPFPHLYSENSFSWVSDGDSCGLMWVYNSVLLSPWTQVLCSALTQPIGLAPPV